MQSTADRRFYVFSASWDLAAAPDDVAAVLVDLERYPDWWPQVRSVSKIDEDSARVSCRSALPYTLDLVLNAISRTPPVVEVALSGDLTGFARFSLVPSAQGTHLDFHQEVRPGGIVAVASYILRPVLAWNHRQMMAGCERGLRDRF